MEKKRILDESKQKELTEVDLNRGRLVEDRLFIAHHEAANEVKEVSHVEVLAEYSNGGKDVQTMIDSPYQPARAAWDEYEDIQIFIPYSEAEIAANRERAYKAAIIAKIRERYSLDDELSIARQRDTKPDEWKEYNIYCEQCKAEAKKED